jgi:gluconate kinase
MPAGLLQSQFEALEEPTPSEQALIVDIGPPADQIADRIIDLLGPASGTQR